MDYIEHSRIRELDNTKQNRMRTNVLLEPMTKKLINFSILQLYIDQNKMTHPIILHDYSHDCYNIHKYYLGHEKRHEVYEEPLQDELYYRAKKDVLQNWRYYRNEYLGRFLPNELQNQNKD